MSFLKGAQTRALQVLLTPGRWVGREAGALEVTSHARAISHSCGSGVAPREYKWGRLDKEGRSQFAYSRRKVTRIRRQVHLLGVAADHLLRGASPLRVLN